MNVEYDAPIKKGNVTRDGVLIFELITYEKNVVLNFIDAPPLNLPLDGLSDADLAKHLDWLEMWKRNTKGEHQSGEVTARIAGKLEMKRLEAEQAAQAEKVAKETIEALEE